ncbi:MAG: hypothetical protein V4687_13805 [Bacteroidota bacterium]
MENTIETIWKQGFVDESSLMAPKINDLYNKKSMHVVDKMKRMLRINLIAMLVMAIVFPVMYYFLDVIWQGFAASVLVLFTAWYTRKLMARIRAIDQGASSLDYLKSVDQWITEVIFSSEKIVRFLYPLYFLIAYSAIWSTLKNQELLAKWQHKYPQVTFIEQLPMLFLITGAVVALLLFYFSDRIYRYDVRLMYGKVFCKLKSTIAEMEELRA